MANDVTNSNRNQIDPFAQYGEEVSSRAHIVGDLLRFTKHGQYKARQEQDEIPEGTRMLAYMPSLKRGWVKWWDNQPVQHIVGLVIESYQPPERSELGDLDENEWGELNGRRIDPWQKTNYLVMCDEEGQLYTFVTASKGGLSAVGEVSSAYSKWRKMKPDEIPIIELHSTSYNHRDYGETFKPILKITGWAKIPDNFSEVSATLANGGGEAETFVLPATPMETMKPVEKPVVKPETKPPARPAPKPVLAKGGKNNKGKGVRF